MCGSIPGKQIDDEDYCRIFSNAIKRLKEEAAVSYDSDFIERLNNLHSIFRDAVEYHKQVMKMHKAMHEIEIKNLEIKINDNK